MPTPKEVISDFFEVTERRAGRCVQTLDAAGYVIVPKEPPGTGWIAKDVEEWCKARFVQPKHFWRLIQHIAEQQTKEAANPKADGS